MRKKDIIISENGGPFSFRSMMIRFIQNPNLCKLVREGQRCGREWNRELNAFN
jgi:hypothetical protein